MQIVLLPDVSKDFTPLFNLKPVTTRSSARTICRWCSWWWSHETRVKTALSSDLHERHRVVQSTDKPKAVRLSLTNPKAGQDPPQTLWGEDRASADERVLQELGSQFHGFCKREENLRKHDAFPMIFHRTTLHPIRELVLHDRCVLVLKSPNFVKLVIPSTPFSGSFDTWLA